MKRFLAILIVVSLVVLSNPFFVKPATAAEVIKIGYIDVATVFDTYDRTKDEDAALTAKSQSKQKEHDRMVERVKNMKNELELLNEAQRQKKQSEIDEEIRKLQDFDREAKESLKKERDGMVRDILKEIDATIQEYSKKNGYTLVLNSRVLVYAQDQNDITREILNILNSKYRRTKQQ
jgi:outer membrane protein